jgi:transcriptional regulator with XRE-family HTH domain
MTFAEKLRSKRAALNLTQPEMAAALSLSLRAYINFESGQRVPLAIAQEGALARIAKLRKKARL